MRKVAPSLSEIKDPAIRRVFEEVLAHLNGQVILRGEWAFLEKEFTGAVTNAKVRHSLGFVPKDVIQLYKSGAGAITWNYDSFDGDYLDVTTTGALTVRAFVGRYREA